MAKFTKKNLKQVEDQAKKFGVDGQEMHAARADLEATKLALSYQKFVPQHRIEFGHSHDEQEEVYVVTRGSGRMKIGDEVIELKELDAVRVAPEMVRAIEAGPGGIEFIAIGAPYVESDRGNMKQGWWA